MSLTAIEELMAEREARGAAEGLLKGKAEGPIAAILHMVSEGRATREVAKAEILDLCAAGSITRAQADAAIALPGRLQPITDARRRRAALPGHSDIVPPRTSARRAFAERSASSQGSQMLVHRSLRRRQVEPDGGFAAVPIDALHGIAHAQGGHEAAAVALELEAQLVQLSGDGGMRARHCLPQHRDGQGVDGAIHGLACHRRLRADSSPRLLIPPSQLSRPHAGMLNAAARTTSDVVARSHQLVPDRGTGAWTGNRSGFAHGRLE